MKQSELEAVLLIRRLRKTMCYLGNHPRHENSALAATRAVADIDNFIDTHGPDAKDVVDAVSGLSHFDAAPNNER